MDQESFKRGASEIARSQIAEIKYFPEIYGGLSRYIILTIQHLITLSKVIEKLHNFINKKIAMLQRTRYFYSNIETTVPTAQFCLKTIK